MIDSDEQELNVDQPRDIGDVIRFLSEERHIPVEDSDNPASAKVLKALYREHLDTQISNLQTLLGLYQQTKAALEEEEDQISGDSILPYFPAASEGTLIDRLLHLYREEVSTAGLDVARALPFQDTSSALATTPRQQIDLTQIGPRGEQYTWPRDYLPVKLFAQVKGPAVPEDPLGGERSLLQLIAVRDPTDTRGSRGGGGSHYMDEQTAERIWVLVVGILFGLILGGFGLLYLIRRMVHRKSLHLEDGAMLKTESGLASNSDSGKGLVGSASYASSLGEKEGSEAGGMEWRTNDLSPWGGLGAGKDLQDRPAGAVDSAETPGPESKVSVDDAQSEAGSEGPLSQASSASRDRAPATPTGSGLFDWEIDYNQIQIQSRIGIGAFGEVLKGDWRGTPVAVKRLWHMENRGVSSEGNRSSLDPIPDDEVLAGDGDDGEGPTLTEVLEDIEREVRILASLRHPNVVLFMGACRVAPDIAIVMELCARGSLDRVLYLPASQPVLDVKRRLRMALHIARGMSFLHALSPPIIHRDLKPGNLLVTQNFDIKVCDFGISHTHNKTLATATTKIGTAQYAAPEMLESDAYTEKIDVWSFGVILWEIISKRRPYANHVSIYQVINAVVVNKERLTPLTEIADLVNDWGANLDTLGGVSQIHGACTATDGDERPSFNDIQERLDTMAGLLGSKG